MANMAKWQRLTPFADIGLVGDFAERFGLDPDWVFDNKSFSTVLAFAVESKERSEYRERFNYIWKQINDSSASHTNSEHGSGNN